MQYPERTLFVMGLSILLVTVIIPVSQNTDAAGETEMTHPSSVAVTYGTAFGAIDDVSAQDGVSYSVTEVDVNAGRSYTNDTIDPNAVGTNTAWTGEVGPGADHYEAVDEGPPHDTDVSYVFQTVAGGGAGVAIDTYNAEDYTLAPGYTIDEMRVSGYAREDIASGTTYNNCVLSGVTLSCGAGNTLTLIYTNYTTSYTTDPDTGIAWIDSGIDSVEIGHKAVWNPPNVATTMRSTVVFATVQSSAPIDDYTLTYDFTFTNIEYRKKPYLEVSGYRTGDVENILVQVSRLGVWTTLSADAFDTTLTTVQYDLSTTDVLGGSATVRIIDADNTDNTATEVYIDEIFIHTEGEPPSPQSSIKVYTQSEYLMWENRLKINIFWEQVGGPEKGEVINKWVTVTIDGHPVGAGIFQVEGDFIYVPVPWGPIDPDLHNGTIVGYVLIDWTAGSATYVSEPEHITLDNIIRFAFIVFFVSFFIIVALYFFVRALNEYRLMKERT